MNPALAQVIAEVMRALQHAQHLYGAEQPSADVPDFHRPRDPGHRARRRWNRGHYRNHLPTTSAEPGVRAAQAALSQRGARYGWGAESPGHAFDCSGLTQYAWRHAGVNLGRDTWHQINEGIPVPHGQVRAGDLIFPSDAHGGHVQLAINPHEVVEAPTYGVPIRVAPMPHAYVARRPVPA